MKKREYGTICLLLAAFVMLLQACRKDLPLPDVGGEKKLTMLGEFVLGDTFLLRAGQSVSVSANSKLQFDLLQNISISLEEPTGAKYNMAAYTDSFSWRLFTYPFSLSRKVQANSTYKVTATHPTLGTATAIVNIPAQVDAFVVDTAGVQYSGDTTLRIKVQINDPANTTDYYVIEAVKQKMNVIGYFQQNGGWKLINEDRIMYDELKANGTVVTRFDTIYYNDYIRQPIYTTDVNTENLLDVGSFTRSRRVLLKDQRINGTSYRTDVYVIKNTDPATENGLWKGRIILYIKAVSADYFKFLKSYEVYNPSSGFNSFEQPVKIEGNVKNGMGIIGGVSVQKYTYMYDIWNY
ncbi:hypothetical protein CAP35_10645 [Chitinophagaceae bacterium IBVUCB1]|nr:hypothetical protein CAP35_10645 [Chitinophagaceae bacterium IBVUCB1]